MNYRTTSKCVLWLHLVHAAAMTRHVYPLQVILRELQAAARAPRRVTRIHAPMLQRGRDQ